MFSHQFARNTDNLEIKRALALSRRVEAQQQKVVNGLNPGDQTPLETTIGYEQVAVDLTVVAGPSRARPDAQAGARLRAARGLRPPVPLRQPVRPARRQGRHRADRQPHRDHAGPARPSSSTATRTTTCAATTTTHTVDPLSRMHVMTIVAAEQQTMNFYMNHGTDWIEPIARGLYAEIALIEEQHVTHYESLLDPLDSWLKQLVFHEYNEVYLYWSMLQNEEDQRIKAIWELHLDMEIGQLQAACDLLRRYEGIEPEEILPPGAARHAGDVRAEQGVRAGDPRPRRSTCAPTASTTCRTPSCPTTTAPGATARWSTPAAPPASWSSTRTVPAAATSTGTRPRENTRWSSCGPDPTRLSEEERDGCHEAGSFARIKRTNSHERRRTGGRRPAAADLSAGSLRRVDGRARPGAALPARQPRPRTAAGRSRT